MARSAHEIINRQCAAILIHVLHEIIDKRGKFEQRENVYKMF